MERCESYNIIIKVYVLGEVHNNVLKMNIISSFSSKKYLMYYNF